MSVYKYMCSMHTLRKRKKNKKPATQNNIGILEKKAKASERMSWRRSFLFLLLLEGMAIWSMVTACLKVPGDGADQCGAKKPNVLLGSVLWGTPLVLPFSIHSVCLCPQFFLTTEVKMASSLSLFWRAFLNGWWKEPITFPVGCKELLCCF